MDSLMEASTPILNKPPNSANQELLPIISTKRRGKLVKRTLFLDTAAYNHQHISQGDRDKISSLGFEQNEEIQKDTSCPLSKHERPPKRASAALACTSWRYQLEDQENEEVTMTSYNADSYKKKRGMKKFREREKTSLYLLTLQFLDMLHQQGLVNLNKASRMLGAKKRRLYDITCVLHAMGCVCKPMKNFVEILKPVYSLSGIRDFAVSRKLESNNEKFEDFSDNKRHCDTLSLNTVDRLLEYRKIDYEGYLCEGDATLLLLPGVNMQQIDIFREETDEVEFEVEFLEDGPVLYWKEWSDDPNGNWHVISQTQIVSNFKNIYDLIHEDFSDAGQFPVFTDISMSHILSSPSACYEMEGEDSEMENIRMSQELLVSLLDDEKSSIKEEFDTLHCLTTPTKAN
eukprot:jgi/Galph1/3613/GphlegSOOS_G2271.1